MGDRRHQDSVDGAARGAALRRDACAARGAVGRDGESVGGSFGESFGDGTSRIGTRGGVIGGGILGSARAVGGVGRPCGGWSGHGLT